MWRNCFASRSFQLDGRRGTAALAPNKLSYNTSTFFFFFKKKKKKKHVEEELRAQVTRFKRTRKSDPRYNNRNLFLKFAILSSSILQFRNSFVAIHFSNDIKEFHSICQSQEKDQKWCLNGRKIIFTEFLF